MLKNQNIVVKFVAINTAVFLILLILNVLTQLFNATGFYEFIIKLLSVPSSLKGLLTRFWTPFTYMFVHEGFWHLLGNMLWLYFIGILLIEYVNEKEFTALYILGGLSGAALYIVAYNIFPLFTAEKYFSILLGASASVTAIVIATAMLMPERELYFFGVIRVRLWIIAIIMIIYDISLLSGTNAGGHFAHLGGAIFGFIYGKKLKNGINILDFANNFSFSKHKRKVARSKSKMTIDFHTSDDYEYKEKLHEIKTEIDRILDKISKKGYGSLTKKEKEFLKKYGDKYN